MEEDLRKLLDMLYETEALVEMSLRRGNASPSSTVVRLVAEKCQRMASISSSWELTDNEDAQTECDCARVYDSTTTTEEEDDLALADSELQEIAAMASVNPEEDESDNAVSENKVEVTAKDLEYMTDELDPEIKETVDKVMFNPPKGYDPEDNERVGETESDKVPHFVEEEDFVSDYNAEKKEGRDVLYEPEHKRAPLLSFFTINDRFRFRRSLFEGSNPKLLESLSVIESLESPEQAVEYMANDLCWDMENPEVGLFCRIVERYFKSSTK